MKKHSRIDIVDTLRGFALVGILLVHTTMFFLAGPLINDLQKSAIVTSFDSMLVSGVYLLVRLKSVFLYFFHLVWLEFLCSAA